MAFLPTRNVARIRIRDNLIGGGTDFESLLLEATSAQAHQFVSKSKCTLLSPADESSNVGGGDQTVLCDSNSTSRYSSNDSTSSTVPSVDVCVGPEFVTEFGPVPYSEVLLWPTSKGRELTNFKPVELIKSKHCAFESEPLGADRPHSCADESDHSNGRAEAKNNVDQKAEGACVSEQLINGKLTKIWQCTVCGREFQHHYTYLRHLPTHTNVRDFVCKLCGKAFRQLSTLSQHGVIHSQERPFTCEVCHKNFNRISTLISHRKTHSTVKTFHCHICQKGFHQKGNLRNHIYIHTNERPYRCTLCSKGFNQMSNLVCHKQKMHAAEVASAWSCSRCAESFAKRHLLRAHELQAHQVEHESSDNSSDRVEENGGAAQDESEKKTAIETVSLENREPMLIIPIQPASPTNAHIQTLPQPSILSQTHLSLPAHPVANRGIIIPAIKTEAMNTIRQNHEIPFAVLHFLQCVPLLVRIIDFHDQSMLRPANKYDFEELRSVAKNNASKRVSVPVVAAVYQTLEHNGTTSYVVMPPKNIYKFNSDLQNLIMQDAVFSMALNPAVANTSTGTKTVPKKTRAAPLAQPAAPVKRKRRPVQAVVRKRSKNERTKVVVAPTIASAETVELPQPLMAKGPSVCVFQPSFQVVEQEHLSDNGDITEAIQGFATGSFLSPKRIRSQIISPTSETDLASPQSTTSTTCSSSTAVSAASSDAEATNAFMTLVAALQSDGHTADFDSIKEFIYSSGMFGAEETTIASEVVVQP